MAAFFQYLLSGFMIGSIYAMIALGFVLIYKSSRIINFAQGELLLLGAFFCFTLMVSFGLPVWAGFMLTFLFAAALGFLLERLTIRPLIGQPLLSVVIMTLGLSIILRAIVLIGWGPLTRAYPEIFPVESVHLGGVTLSQQHLYSFIIAIAAFAAFALFFRFSKMGLAMRAVAEDHQVARGVGVDVKKVFSLAWVVSGTVAALGGILLGSISGININLSLLGLKALPVVLLGGMESIPGAIVGGLIIGASETLAAGYLDPILTAITPQGGGISGIFPFIIMIIVLLFRPYGIFGLKTIERI